MNDENAPTANEQSTSADNQPSPAVSIDDTARVEKLARTYRHIGYAIFGTLALALAVFLFASAIIAVNDHTVIDPQTGQPFYDDAAK